MKRSLFLLLIWVLATGISAQNPDEQFAEKFAAAKKWLYDFHPDEALPILLNLYKTHPDNHNLEYLIGACYTDYSPEQELSIQYLEKAKPFVTDHYDADDPNEKGVSIHLYYFLAVAYAQNGRCEEAKTSNEKFHELIGKIGQAYLRDAQFWVDACHKLKTKPDTKTDAVEKQPRENALDESKFVTQSVSYSTPTPLFGVQVGSFSKYLPKNSFDDIKNVDAFLDKEGKVRYVVGKFTFKRQAETLQKVLQESGYRDAFIVDVNKERKFSKKIISVNDVSIKEKIRGAVHFRCQIGAFRDTIPEDMARKYLKVSGIKENIQGDLTLLSVGHFETYEEAKLYVDELDALDIQDAFVVAYDFDHKIPIKDAQTYLSKRTPTDGKRKKR